MTDLDQAASITYNTLKNFAESVRAVQGIFRGKRKLLTQKNL